MQNYIHAFEESSYHTRIATEVSMERSSTHSTHKSQFINNRLQDQYIHQYPFPFILLSLKPLLTIRCITPTTDFCLIPIGTPTASVSNEVAAVQRLLKKAKNIKYTMHSAGTTLGKYWNQTIQTYPTLSIHPQTPQRTHPISREKDKKTSPLPSSYQTSPSTPPPDPTILKTKQKAPGTK
jgi:hypothetical protein